MKRPRDGFQRIVRPMGPAWEVWQIPDHAPPPTEPASSHAVPPSAQQNEDVLAMPARLVVSAAIWVPAVEPSELDAAVRLELELSGLAAPKASASSIFFRTIAEENSRTLVAASLFPADLPDSLIGLNFRHFEASPHLLNLPENAATLWREAEDLVLCFTRGASAIVWETIHADASDHEISLWMRLLATQLQAEGVISPWFEWNDPTNVLNDRDIPPPQGGTWNTIRTTHLAPKLPAQRSAWQPPSTLQVIDQSQRKQKVRQLLYATLAAYLALVFIALGYIGFMKVRAAMMASERDRLGAEVEQFAPVSKAWQLVSPTVESEQFPLEILLQLVTNMPDSGIRLTTLNMSENEVLVEGEASSVTLASHFFDSIESDEDFRHVTWEMPPPSLLPNSTARFQMRGTIRTL